MPDQELPAQPAGTAENPEQGQGPSRRWVLRGAAGAAGVAVAAGAGVLALASYASNSPASAKDTAASSGPIVIYLHDAKTGVMDIFAGTGQSRQTNPSMAATVASMAPR